MTARAEPAARSGGAHEQAVPAAAGVVVVTRHLAAPPRLVFRAWTRPEHIVRWWGPEGFSTHGCEVDLRPGGVFRLTMRSPDGALHHRHGLFREVVEPERLVFTWAGTNADGTPGHDTVVSVTFAEHGTGGTLLTLRQGAFASGTEGEARRRGWGQGLERLAAYLGDADGDAAPSG